MFLPDTALLVPGAGGAADPASGLRAAAVAVLGATGAVQRVLVVAPGRRTRLLRHPVGLGLGAAGLDVPAADVAGLEPAGSGSVREHLRPEDPVPPARRADVAASTALLLLRAAGVRAPVDVVELARAGADPAPLPGLGDDVGLLVVVGSLSARHGPDAPLADDPRAPAADVALLAALGAGPVALADALDALGTDGAADLAVSGAAPWRSALGLLPAGAVDVTTRYAEVLAGAQHAVVAWTVTPSTPAPRTATPRTPSRGTATSTAPEEPR